MPREPRSAFVVVGERLRDARLARNLTQEETAGAAKINTSYYGKLERGKVNPTLDTLVRVADALAVSLPELVAGLRTAQLPQRSTWPKRGPR